MPGTRCTVAVCNNSFAKTKKLGIQIKYHKFPKDEPFRSLWIERCQRAGEWNPNSCHICSIHFTDNDYKKDVSAEILKLPNKKKLKKSAVPSLYLTNPPPIEDTTKRKRRKTPQEILANKKDNQNTFFPEDDPSIADLTNEDLMMYKISDEINSTEGNLMYIPDSKDADIELMNVEGLESFFAVDEPCEVKYPKMEEQHTKSRLPYTHMKDCSTQTDTDYFFLNFKILLDKNISLENEVDAWSNKYKKLLSTIQLLESKVHRLTLNATQHQ